MATNDSFEFDPVPGYTKPTHEYGTEFGDEFHAPKVVELLKSAGPYRQRGVTLAGGQGLLPAGTVLAQRASDSKYYVYQSANSGGLNVAVGFLRDARDTGSGTNGVAAGANGFTTATSPSGKVATDCLGNIVTHGEVDLTLISGTDTASLVTNTGGGIGSGATGVVNQLNGRVDQAVGSFIF